MLTHSQTQKFIAKVGYVCVCAVWVSLADGAQAGCHQGLSSDATVQVGSSERLCESTPWAKGPAFVIYESGKLTYYPPSGDVPCDGPECRGSDSPNWTPVSAAPTSRIPVASSERPRPVYGVTATCGEPEELVEEYSLLLAHNLLRPPQL